MALVAPVICHAASSAQTTGEKEPVASVNASVMHTDGRVRSGALTAVDDAGVTVRPTTGAIERVPWSSIIGVITGVPAQPGTWRPRVTLPLCRVQ